ncbi:MAG: hypothetical protein WAN11_23610 [Syntrophobacteraceae bacterium]
MAKKKINDDTLLQLIRDGNSPAGAARRFPLSPQSSVLPTIGMIALGICQRTIYGMIGR